MPSFDIVSEVEMNEVRNAVENANRELATRYDFRGVEASFELNDNKVKLAADAELQLQQMRDMLRGALIKRGIDVRVLDAGSIVRSGKRHVQEMSFLQGIDSALAKKLVKKIKDSKIKVQASIQGEQLRVTGKKRDDLQQVMAMLRAEEQEQPLQFNNFRD
ncbi:YajQ family cyclic di-GMP-binding protein [Oceanimonas doudoroffii]|uniref:Nucleotide-binding protein B6S08_15340 n=1 Tax=Oceanimonas doudoroffii TaxID=84158 RepID=A0A233RBN1_9GAMM|nr:YajQ family cyclic di-GMP-binding protein [Oceanimonas doudoroffii]OXY80802.1 YajQ family cyclic di-GMP-binding protein [Oceanimonas doudoroffii]